MNSHLTPTTATLSTQFFQREAPRFWQGHPANIAIIGGGAFGSALASVAATGGCQVTIISQTPPRQDTANDPVFQKITYILTENWHEPLQNFDLIILAVPAQALRSVCTWLKHQWDAHKEKFPHKEMLLICAAKGIEQKTLLLPYQIIEELIPDAQHIGILSGPSFAKELRQGLPAAVTLATQSELLKECAKSLLHRAHFRIYSSNDVIGVEVAGALKNVIAIVAGGCDGLGLGNNARAAVVTRGFGEIVQIGMVLGADPMTFLGLSGLGDLFLTTTGDLSRNRQFGFRLAQGEPKEHILAQLGEVVEGVATAESAYHISQKFSLDTPIIQTAYRVLYENLSIGEALFALITRHHKGEFDWMKKLAWFKEQKG